MDTDGQKQKVETKATRRYKLVRALGMCCVGLGVMGMALPFFNSALIARNSRAIDLEQITASQMAANRKDLPSFPHEDIEEIGYVKFWADLGNYAEDEIVGSLHLPSLDIHLPIFQTASNANLLAGLGELLADAQMGEGNYAISGHRAQGKGVLLNRLMEAELGKTLYLTDKKTLYVYRIVDLVQTEITATDRLAQDQVRNYGGKPIASLMTCYFGKSSSRWFVIGQLEQTLPYSPAQVREEMAPPSH